MAVVPPSDDDIAAIADRYGLGLGARDIEQYQALIAGALASYDAVERLYEARLPEPPAREWQWPAAASNELGAWYVTSEITEAADGPLAGRRIAVKDNIAVAGLPMMNGSATVEGYVPRRDATVVTRLLAAGATIAGKAVCEELCFDGGSHTAKTGPVHNPWNRAKTTGGSSSGSAALVAAGDADMALGGDQAGSIRIPSAFCGTVGHKPTYGLVPYTGAFPIENTIDHVGPITRTVRDAALMLGVLAGRDGLDPRQRFDPPEGGYTDGLDDGVAGLRIGVIEEGFAIPGISQPGVDETVRAAIATLEAAGAAVSRVSIPWHRDAPHLWSVIGTDGAMNQMLDGNGYGMNVPGLYDPELIAHFARGRREHAAEMSVTLKLTTLLGRYSLDRHGNRYYAMARNLALELTAAYDAALAEADVLVMPTLPVVAFDIPQGSASAEEVMAISVGLMPNTCPFDVTGHPATSVPAGLHDGLPVGLMIVGRHLADATCLRVAQAYETAVGGFPAPPALLHRRRGGCRADARLTVPARCCLFLIPNETGRSPLGNRLPGCRVGAVRGRRAGDGGGFAGQVYRGCASSPPGASRVISGRSGAAELGDLHPLSCIGRPAVNSSESAIRPYGRPCSTSLSVISQVPGSRAPTRRSG